MHDLGTRLRRIAASAPPPGGDVAGVARRAARLRIRRRLGTSVVAVVVAAGGVVPLVVLSKVDHPSHGSAPGPADTAPSGIAGYGISLPLPEGWDGRVYLDPDNTGPTLQAATLGLPPTGSPDDDVASATRAAMGPDDIVVVVQELSDICPCDSFDHVELPIRVTVSPGGGGEEGVEPDHAAGRLTFETGGRWFDVHVEIGSSPAPPDLVDEANRVVAGLRIDPSAVPAPRPGWITERNPLNGTSIDVPEGWFVRDDPVPALLEPKIVIAAGSYAFPTGGDCGPDNALTGLPRDGVLLWVLRYGAPNGRAPYEFGPRGDAVDLGPPLGPFECIGRTTHLVLFRDAGGFFQAHVVFGPDAPESARRDAADALASFSATADPEVEAELAACGAGPWTVCPDAAWLYRAGGDAGFTGHGDTGSALMFAGRGAEFYLWSTPASDRATAGEGGYHQVATVGDTDVLGDGVRLTWRTQGFSVWVEAGPHPESQLPSGEALADLVRATQAVAFVPDR